MQAQETLANQPFFIFGSGRNGSTMLNRMLNQHSVLFLPSEQYFLGNSIIKYQLYPFLLWRDLIKIITGELLPTTGSHTWAMDGSEVIKELFHLKDRSLQKVIDMIFRSYGIKMQSDFRIWGDTTPLNTFYLPEVFSLFPEAKYVFLLRDGRDVMSSYKKGGEAFLGDLANPVNGAAHWNHSIEKYEWLKKRTNVLLVRYEELVSDPQSVLSGICSYLDVDFETQMLDFHQDEAQSYMYSEPQHANIKKPISTASIGNWVEQLTDEDQDAIMAINKNLVKYGYL